MTKLEDLTVPVLKKLIRAYNLHTVIKGYSKMNKSDLIKNIKKHFGIDDNTLKPKTHSNINVKNQLNFKSKPKEKKQQIKVIEKPTRIEQEQLQKFENKVQEEKNKKIAQEAKQKEKADELHKKVDNLIQQNINILKKDNIYDAFLEAMKSIKTEKQFTTNPERAIENLQLLESAIEDLKKQNQKKEEDDMKQLTQNIVYLDEMAPELQQHKTFGHKKKNNEEVKSNKVPKSILYELEDDEKLSKSAKDVGFVKCPPRNYIMKKNDEFIKIVDEIVNTLNKSAYKYAYQEKEKYKNVLDKFFKEYYNDLLKNKYITDSSIAISALCSQIGNILPDHIRELTKGGANFYPTPFTCLSKFENSINRGINIFEGTAGLGHILNGIRKIKSKQDDIDKDNYTLKANEYDQLFCSILIIMNPDCDIIQGDYLELNINQIIPFDLIILNPPFTKGTNKKFYFEFLFKSLKLSNQRKEYENINVCELIFISPPIYNEKENDIFYPSQIQEYMPKKLLNELEQKYGSLDDECEFMQGTLIGHCDDFLATKLKTSLYLLLV
jgi:hypothetical protein